MRRLLHISDMHFGRLHLPALEQLEQFVISQSQNFDLIIASGDWTQRARSKQYLSAVQWIKKLSAPVLSVPGNHDVPLYNLWARVKKPYKKYFRFFWCSKVYNYLQ